MVVACPDSTTCAGGTMMCRLEGWLLLAVVLGHAVATPLYHEQESQLALAVASELGQRLASHARLQDSVEGRLGLPAGSGRLGLPSPQELDAIKKVAQILVMLGEQVIPTIIGDVSAPALVLPAPAHANCDAAPAPVVDVPNDPVVQK